MIYVYHKAPFEAKQCTINDCSFLREGGLYRFLVDQVALVHSMDRKDGPYIFCGGICRECMVRCHEDRFRTYRGTMESRFMSLEYDESVFDYRDRVVGIYQVEVIDLDDTLS